MWLTMVITREDLSQALNELLPMRIALDPDNPERYLSLERALEVQTNTEGAWVMMRGRVQWDLIGVRLPFTIERLAITLMPSMVQRHGRQQLALDARIDEADLKRLAEVLESPMIARANQWLAKDDVRIVWDFMHTLDFHFALPGQVSPYDSIRWFALEGRAESSSEGIVLRARFIVQTPPDHAHAPAARATTDTRDVGPPR